MLFQHSRRRASLFLAPVRHILRKHVAHVAHVGPVPHIPSFSRSTRNTICGLARLLGSRISRIPHQLDVERADLPQWASGRAIYPQLHNPTNRRLACRIVAPEFSGDITERYHEWPRVAELCDQIPPPIW